MNIRWNNSLYTTAVPEYDYEEPVSTEDIYQMTDEELDNLYMEVYGWK